MLPLDPRKKCEAERYHTVLAHTGPTKAKIKCEVCGAQRTYTLPKVQARRPTTGTKPRRAVSESSRRMNHQAEYEQLLQANEKAPTQNYNMKTGFQLNHKLQHPKFGLGIIRTAQPDKIEVVFADEVRTLIHNRP